MRLIDADDIHYCMYDLNNYFSFYAVTDDEIAEMPTIDAAPVVHAKWIKNEDMRRMNGHIYDWCCSNCGGFAVKGIYNNYDDKTPYCPKCGAKMDGE